MALQSIWFRRNVRLEQCLISDPAHVVKGDCGDHVRLIQGALSMLDHLEISGTEQAQQLYGPSTANAVLEYKKKRGIINYSYQNQVDDIVGKMTIRSLDTEMLAQERSRSHLLFALGASLTSSRISVIAQNHPLPFRWARQFANAHKPNVRVFQSPPAGTPERNIQLIKEAISASNHGLVIFSVGHGIFKQGFRDQGGFDAADGARLRLGGRGSFGDRKTFVDVFYDEKPPPGSASPFSEKENDERTKPAGAQERLKNFSLYQDLCKAFVAGEVKGVLLLTCNVGQATGFLKKVASQWKTTIIAYNEFTTYQDIVPPGRVRSIFDSDKNKQKSPNPGSNTPFAEIMFPLSLSKMVVIKP